MDDTIPQPLNNHEHPKNHQHLKNHQHPENQLSHNPLDLLQLFNLRTLKAKQCEYETFYSFYFWFPIPTCSHGVTNDSILFGRRRRQENSFEKLTSAVYRCVRGDETCTQVLSTKEQLVCWISVNN